MRRATKISIVLIGLSILAAFIAQAVDIGDVLKAGAIGVVVDKFAGPLDNFINTLTVRKNVESKLATKVVPILSVGTGGYVGAAQVIGPKDKVDQVKAVGQIEGNFSGRTFRVKVLIPVTAKDVTKDLRRVEGVGISSVIDIKI